ncbi:MAG TPA: hypothetical protein VMT18_03985, partial [Planctomycetota bacterium]|nr:hypothetical protein [Planctomycetota bacterium]
AGAPHFRFLSVLQQGQDVRIAIDPARYPDLVGKLGQVHVVAARDAAQWDSDPTLVDVTGAPTPFLLQAGSIAANVVTVDAGTLAGSAGDTWGVGYDVVIDYDGDGRLSAGDAIDGAGDATGFWVVGDATQPGPHAVTEVIYSGGSFLGQDLYYPTDVANLGELPLVVISHGNGHDYRWYDHLGLHLASWGCVVMSHQNNTQPGVESASVTTLSNTEYLLGNLASIESGALLGHVDAARIVWFGHSRGGEGVVRAYDKLVDGAYVPVNFTTASLRLVGSIAPTQFLLSDQITPHEVPYHLFVGAADSDVNGGPSSAVAQSIPIFERARGEKLCQSLQGAGHAAFHNQSTNCYCVGPDLIGKAGTHPVMKAYYLALVQRHTRDNPAALGFLERAFDELAPLGVPSNVIVANDYRPAAASARLVIDDFQSEPDTLIASSGAAITANVYDLAEGLMVDLDASFVFSAAAPFNGMTRTRDAGDDPRCAVLDWDGSLGPQRLEYRLLPEQRDLSGYAWLGFRACQGTRHPQTDLLDAPLSFGVTLIDGAGSSSTLPVAPYGRLTRPYERGGWGTGVGWANEMVGLRLGLREFTHDVPAFDLADVRLLRFEFDASVGDERGRIGLDDIEFLPRESQ